MTPTAVALIVFLALQLGIGVWVTKYIANEADYLLGGKRLGYVLVTFSLFATWFGAETVIGSSGEIYGGGITLASAEPFGYGLCLILAGALLAKPLHDRGLTTLADLYRQRFGVGVERLAAMLMIPSSVLWAAAQVRAFGHVIATVSPVNVTAAIAIAAAFTIAYTAFGGLLADAVTDVLQGVILSIGLITMLIAVVMRVGGPGEAIALLAHTDKVNLAPTAAGPWFETLEAWAIPVLGSLAATEIVSRVIAARTRTVAQRASFAAGALYITIGSIPVVIALLGTHLVGQIADPEQLLPTVAHDMLPTVLFAVFAGGLISAILSTVDSTLLVASGLLSHNLIIPMAGITNERTKVRLARGGVLVFGALAYVLAVNADGVFVLVEQASAFGSAGLLVTVLFALFTPWGSARTAALTLVGGMVVFAVASAQGLATPYLASLGASLACWGLGSAYDVIAVRRVNAAD
ncbi:MAG: sodium:solute symporter family protein [Gemmatimonadaceae bacterium]|nr:sodium:solute symporter family protein [Gemmatimonadaceae bacterium]